MFIYIYLYIYIFIHIHICIYYPILAEPAFFNFAKIYIYLHNRYFSPVQYWLKKIRLEKKRKKAEEKPKTKSFHTPDGKATSTNIFLKS